MKYVLSFDEFLNEAIREISSFMNNIKNIPGIGKAYKVPSIDTIKQDKTNLTFYGKTYRLPNGNSFRLNSVDKSFKTIVSVDIFTIDKINPRISLTELDKISDVKDFEKMMSKVLHSPELKKMQVPLIKEDEIIPDDFKYNEINEINKNSLMAFASFLPVILGVITILISWGIKARKTYQEKQVYFDAQLAKDEKIFSKLRNDPDNDFKVYATLSNMVDIIISGKRTSLLINGRPGTGKTFLTKKRLYLAGKREGTDFIIIKGSTDLEGFFTDLYDYRRKIIIFDDCDSLFKNDDFVNILKSVTDSTGRRLVSLRTGKSFSAGSKENPSELPVPKTFEFTGKIIIITNLPTKSLPPAIISRTGAYTVSLSPDEMVERVHRIMKNIRPDVSMKEKEDVFNYLKELYAENPNMTFDLRIFTYAIDDRTSGISNWKDLVKSRVILTDDL